MAGTDLAVAQAVEQAYAAFKTDRLPRDIALAPTESRRQAIDPIRSPPSVTSGRSNCFRSPRRR